MDPVDKSDEESSFDMEAAVNEISSSLFPEQSSQVDADNAAGTALPDAARGTAGDGNQVADKGPDNAPIIDPNKPAADASPQPAPDAAAGEAPQTWTAPAKAEWAKLPPLVRAEIQKREQDMFRGLEQYREKANFGVQVQNQLAPYMGVLQRYKIDPLVQIGALMAAHHTLALGSVEQKTALFRQFAKDYNVDLAAILGTAAAPNAGTQDPTVNDLRSRVESVQSRLEARERADVEQRNGALRQTIQQFAADPANEFFQFVVEDMTKLFRAGVTSDLKEAYQTAIWSKAELRPYLLAKMVPQTTPEQAETARQQARTKAAAAQAANVRSRPSGASGTTGPVGTIDETMSETLRAIKGRG